VTLALALIPWWGWLAIAAGVAAVAFFVWKGLGSGGSGGGFWH